MTDPTLARAHRRAVRAMRTGDRYRWMVAMQAGFISGKYTEGAIRDLALDCHCSTDTLYRLARGWRVYVSLRYFLKAEGEPRQVRGLRMLRAELRPSHFAAVAHLIVAEKYWEAFAQLDTAEQGGASPESLASNGHVPDAPLPVWVWGQSPVQLANGQRFVVLPVGWQGDYARVVKARGGD